MPHVTLECTANIKMTFQSFFEELSEKFVATGYVSRLGVKCRVLSSDDYYIIDGNPEFKMANLLIRLREGRSQEALKLFSQIGMNLLEKYLEEDVQKKSIILSTEIKELKTGLDLTQNYIRKLKL